LTDSLEEFNVKYGSLWVKGNTAWVKCIGWTVLSSLSDNRSAILNPVLGDTDNIVGRNRDRLTIPITECPSLFLNYLTDRSPSL
jgi:hypothetical protein